MNKFLEQLNNNPAIAWFNKNKVVIVGIIMTIAGPIVEVSRTGTLSWTIVLVGIIVGISTYLARNLRGKWLTIIGIIQMAFAPYIDLPTLQLTMDYHQIPYGQLAFQIAVLIYSSAAPAAKSIGYEHTDIIMEAKQEGEIAKPTFAPPQP